MALNGVIFKTPDKFSETETNVRYADLLAVGQVSREPEETCHKVPCVSWGLRYARKQFVNCNVYGDGTPLYEVAKTLHAGDMILVTGKLRTKTFETKNGPKEYFDLAVSFLIPQASILETVIATIQRMPPTYQEDVMEGEIDIRASNNEFDPADYGDSPF